MPFMQLLCGIQNVGDADITLMDASTVITPDFKYTRV